MEHIKEKLSQGGYKLTRQRQVILEVMQDSEGEHLSAEEVLQVARHKSPSLGIATVYRTLERLAGLGILYKTRFDEGKYRYELADDAEHQHHHVQCIRCGRIFELDEGLLDSIEQEIMKQGFTVINHFLTIYAICPECNQD
ncbi:MAG TPA: Fur family transcriptional regulator [Syntrophomonadaceae bacterium]|jgi:Fur family ferric uptake transcriptional regulator|nr:Fur family transcriptional regulator [Syntrophomonadaceae bacterium]